MAEPEWARSSSEKGLEGVAIVPQLENTPPSERGALGASLMEGSLWAEAPSLSLCVCVSTLVFGCVCVCVWMLVLF